MPIDHNSGCRGKKVVCALLWRYTYDMVQDTASKKGDASRPRWAVMGQRFYAQALVDLESARENVRPRRGNNAVRFAHEAAEKALKGAYWHLLAGEPPWTHQLAGVAASLATAAGGAGGTVPEEITVAMGILMASWEESRYPSGNVDDPIPADMVDTTEATEAVEHAEKVIAWAGTFLQLPTGKPRRKKS